MEGKNRRTTIELPAQIVNGKVFKEEILVDTLGENKYRLVRSPGMIEGLAAQDEIEINGSEKKGYRLLRRGGNVSIHFMREAGVAECVQAISEIKKIGGWLDGQTRQELVFTIPVKTGFPLMDSVLRQLQSEYPDATILYGNVYDPEDGETPLNWWKEVH